MYVTVVNAQQMSHANVFKQKIQLRARALKTRAGVFATSIQIAEPIALNGTKISAL